jgi:acyl-CoA synthetase (AMP-forming)/AMP-acid ligase II
MPPTQIATLLESQRSEHPERPAVVYADSVLSFRELGARVDRLAERLTVEPGARVAVVAPNVPALVVGLFAAWRVGAVAVPLSSRLRRFELARAFADAEPAVVLSVASRTQAGTTVTAEGVPDDSPALALRLIVDQLGEVVDEQRLQAPARPEPLGPEIAAIMYTSGTTGEPKGALMPHAMGEATGPELAQLLGSDADAAVGFVIPIPHAFGLACLLASVAGGAAAIMVDATISLAPLLEAMRRHDAGVLHGTPAMWAGLLRSGAELAVRTGFTAGSSCPPEVLEALDERGARILNLYGMTEIGAASACRADDPAEVRHHTIGRPLPGYEFRIIAESRDTPAGGPGTKPQDPPLEGEIQVRSPLISPGYHRRPWTEDEDAGDGWFRTGDLGCVDALGNNVIVGRAKEVVHVGGFNVFPAEVENFLMTHPQIAQAAVIGVPHPAMGESVRAFVIATPGSKLAPADVIRFAREGIAGYKVPYSVQLVDELPLLRSGKPDRRQLKRSVEASR